MEFIETSVFTKVIQDVMDDSVFALLQEYLYYFPSAGKLIRGSGGLRKIRWKSSLRGKRGGLRVIYYWHKDNHQILFLYAYKKDKQADLTRLQLKQLKEIMRKSYG